MMPKRAALRRIDQQLTTVTTAVTSSTGSSTSSYAPDTLTVSTTNDESGNKHTHAITTSSNPGAAAAILATSATGALTIGGDFTAAGNITGNDFSGADMTLTGTIDAEIGAITKLNLGTAVSAGTGDVRYSGDLEPLRNGTYYTGYAVVPLTTPLTSTSWDGDTKDEMNTGTIDLQAVFGAPANIKGVFASVGVRGATVEDNIAFGPSLTYDSALVAVVQVSNKWVQQAGMIPCNANGDIAVNVISSGGVEVYLKIYGYIL